MLMIFYRKVINDVKVVSRVVALVDGRSVEVGELKFPSKQVWSKFIGAVQRGALEIPDLEVRMENSVDHDYDDNTGPGQEEFIGVTMPPPPKFILTDLEKKAVEIHKATLQRQAEEAGAAPAPSRFPVSNAEARRVEMLKTTPGSSNVTIPAPGVKVIGEAAKEPKELKEINQNEQAK